MHPASHSFPIDTCEIRVRLVIMCPSHDSLGKAGNSSIHGLIDFMFWPFGHPTWMVGPMFFNGVFGASTCK